MQLTGMGLYIGVKFVAVSLNYCYKLIIFSHRLILYAYTHVGCITYF